MSRSKPMSKAMNIIMLVGEDVGRHLGCYGERYAHTPNLDRLAREGCLFTNGHSHSPVCAPSRGGLVTGQYPWSSSMGNFPMRSTLVQTPRLFTHDLMDAGYHVGWPTKTDFNFDDTVPFCTDRETAWWTKTPPDKPFFLFRNFFETHESCMWKNSGEHLQRTSHVAPNDRHDPADAPLPAYVADMPEARQQVAMYHDGLTEIDAQVGEVLQWVDDHGLRENTLVIFMSDHGRGLLREKRWLYDAGTHLPLIMRHPALFESGRVDEQMVAWIDLAPTLLSLVGVEVPQHLQGRVFLGDDTDDTPRRYCFSSRGRMDETFDRIHAVRDPRWRYVRNYYPTLPYAHRNFYMEHASTVRRMYEMNAAGQLHGDTAIFFQPSKPDEELYDCLADPANVRNLADDPACGPVLERMRKALEENLERFGDLTENTEHELVEQGILTDRIEEYTSRLTRHRDIPEKQKVGPKSTITLQQDADAWQAKHT